MALLLKRIIGAGWKNFVRQPASSLAASLVLTITSFLIGVIVLGIAVTSFVVTEAREKADISIYLRDDYESERALELKDEIATISGIKEVSFKSEEDAFDEFVQKHGEDESLMDSLREVGVNPFLASINVRALNVEGFDGVSNFLEASELGDLVEEVDYYERRTVVDKIFELSSMIERGGIIVSIGFILISSFVTFSTIRLAVQSQKEEIKAMRLVGASDMFISGPFVVQAVILGLISFIISFSLLWLLSYLATPKVSVFFSGLRISSFFRGDLLKIAAIQFLSSAVLASVSSVMALRKHSV